MHQALRYVTLFDIYNRRGIRVREAMVKFTDPITDTEYNPIGDPTGTAVKSVYAIAGITMTLLLVSIANNNILPSVQGFLGGVLGTGVGGDSVVGTNGGGL